MCNLRFHIAAETAEICCPYLLFYIKTECLSLYYNAKDYVDIFALGLD